MIKIECMNCHNMISLDTEDSLQKMKCCPFCMKALREEASFDQIDTMGKALYHAVKIGKEQNVRNPRAVLGIMQDETPQ